MGDTVPSIYESHAALQSPDTGQDMSHSITLDGVVFKTAAENLVSSTDRPQAGADAWAPTCLVFGHETLKDKNNGSRSRSDWSRALVAYLRASSRLHWVGVGAPAMQSIERRTLSYSAVH